MDPFQVIGVAVPVVFSIYLALSNRAMSSEKEAVERRLVALERLSVKYEELASRLHANDLVTVALKGDLALANQRAEQLHAGAEEIRKTMVTRDMWNELSKKLDDVLRKYSAFPARYDSSGLKKPDPR